MRHNHYLHWPELSSDEVGVSCKAVNERQGVQNISFDYTKPNVSALKPHNVSNIYEMKSGKSGIVKQAFTISIIVCKQVLSTI